MTASQHYDIRELLNQHVEVQTILWKAVNACSLADYVNQGDGKPRSACDLLVKTLVVCEKRQCSEIALLFDKNGNEHEAAECPACGHWHFGAYDFGAVCADCADVPLSGEPLTKDECDELERCAWTAEDLRAGEPSRA